MSTIEKIIDQRREMSLILSPPDLLTAFIKQNGMSFSPKEYAGKIGEPQACFRNATEAVLRKNGPYIYVEGFAINKSLGSLFHHAWLTDGDKESAFDPTLKTPRNYEYFGVPIPRDMLAHEVHKNGVYGVFEPKHGANLDFMAKLDSRLATVRSYLGV